MPAIRPTLVALGLGAATLTTGVLVASSATATPAPVAAVERLGLSGVPADGATGTASGTTASDGTPRPTARRWWKDLTDAQRTCLQDQGITRPLGPLDDAERTALREKVEAAVTTCDVTLPFARVRAFWAGLTVEQQDCLKDAGLNRPWGPLSTGQRQAVRSDVEEAAERCGVEIPASTAGRQ